MRSSPPVRARRVFLLGPAGVPSDSAVQRKRCPSSFSTYPAFSPLQAGPFYFTLRWARPFALLFQPVFSTHVFYLMILPCPTGGLVGFPGPAPVRPVTVSL